MYQKLVSNGLNGLCLLFAAALVLFSGCAVNIYNSQHVQDSSSSAQQGQSGATATSRTRRTSTKTKTSVTSRNTNSNYDSKNPPVRKTPQNPEIEKNKPVITASDKYKKGRIKIKTGGQVEGRSVAKGKVKIRTKINIDRQDTGHSTVKKDKDGKRTRVGDSGRTTSRPERTRSQKEPCDSDTVEYINPPEEPSENVFGYEQPVYGCFEGEVVFIPANSKSFPENFDTFDVASVLYACEWDIPQRAFDEGFPGVPDQFEWFAIRYTGSFGVSVAGEYTFRILSDDGARLFIDGQSVVNNDGVHAPESKSGVISLSAGEHQMVFEYFQGPRYLIALQLYVTPPEGKEQLFTVR